VSPWALPNSLIQGLLAGASRELNDMLIVRYPPDGGGDCSWGFPAPLPLVRQVGP
jgi:hypothetical protein